MTQKKPEDMSEIELKAHLFDIDNEIKRLQNYAQTVLNILQQKVQESRNANSQDLQNSAKKSALKAKIEEAKALRKSKPTKKAKV